MQTPSKKSRELNNIHTSEYWTPTSKKRKTIPPPNFGDEQQFLNEFANQVHNLKNENSQPGIKQKLVQITDKTQKTPKRQRQEIEDSFAVIPLDTIINTPESTTQQNTTIEKQQTPIITTPNQNQSPVEKTLLPMWFIRSVAAQLIAAVGYLYQKGMLHADLKPENIMFRDNPYIGGKFVEPYLKITDFGNAIALGNIDLYYDKFEVQSLSYRAPEVVAGIPFGREIDMWSIGCILAEMANGHLLFPSQDKSQLLHRMAHMLGPLPEYLYSKGAFYSSLFVQDCETCGLNNYSQQCPDPFLEMCNFVGVKDYLFVDLIVQLLQYDPRKRPTPQQALQHPFFAPLFTFSIFGQTQVGAEIRRIHQGVNIKAMMVYELKKQQNSTQLTKKGCILFDNGTSNQEIPTPLTVNELLQQKIDDSNKELARVYNEIAILHDDIRMLNCKIFYFAKANSELETELAQQQIVNFKPVHNSKELAAEKAKLRDELDRATRKTKELTKIIEGLQKDIIQQGEQHRANIRKLEKEIESLQHDQTQHEDSKQIQVLEEEIRTLRERVKEWNDEKVKLISRESAALTQVLGLEVSLKNARKEQKELKSKLTTVQKTNTALEKEVKLLQGEVAGGKLQAKELSSKLSAQEAQSEGAVRDLEMQLTVLKKDIAASHVAVEKHLSETREKEKANKLLLDKNSKLESTAERHRSEIENLKKTVKEFEKRDREAKVEQIKSMKEITELNEKITKATRQLTTTESLLKIAEAEKEEMATEQSERRKEVASLKEAVTKQITEIEQLHKETGELVKEKSQLEKEIAQKDAKVASQEDKLEKVKKTYKSLLVEYNKTKKEAEELQTDKEKMIEETRNLELATKEKESQTQTEISTLKEERDNISNNLDTLKIEHDQLATRTKKEHDELRKLISQLRNEMDILRQRNPSPTPIPSPSSTLSPANLNYNHISPPSSFNIKSPLPPPASHRPIPRATSYLRDYKTNTNINPSIPITSPLQLNSKRPVATKEPAKPQKNIEDDDVVLL